MLTLLRVSSFLKPQTIKLVLLQICHLQMFKVCVRVCASACVCPRYFPTFILTRQHPAPPHPSPSLSPHMPAPSPHSAPPSSNPTRDYWFTHNLLFNIGEQTFQNLCNLSISMCLSYLVFASAESPRCARLCIQTPRPSKVCLTREELKNEKKKIKETRQMSHSDKREYIHCFLKDKLFSLSGVIHPSFQ